jgi:hypothetical protein
VSIPETRHFYQDRPARSLAVCVGKTLISETREMLCRVARRYVGEKSQDMKHPKIHLAAGQKKKHAKTKVQRKRTREICKPSMATQDTGLCSSFEQTTEKKESLRRQNYGTENLSWQTMVRTRPG